MHRTAHSPLTWLTGGCVCYYFSKLRVKIEPGILNVKCQTETFSEQFLCKSN